MSLSMMDDLSASSTGAATLLDVSYDRNSNRYQQNAKPSLEHYFLLLDRLFGLVEESPYSLLLYIKLTTTYSVLKYPDLAAGAAYKALLLVDAISDDSDEYHGCALEAFKQGTAVFQELRDQAESPSLSCEQLSHYTRQIYTLLAENLLQCGCLRSAHLYCEKGLEEAPGDADLEHIKANLHTAASQTSPGKAHPSEWPDSSLVRRERYPWSTHEPNRLEDLDTLNQMMQAVAPKLEVRAATLPALASTDHGVTEVVQLGVFAKEDLSPGEIVLKETSLLTANNKLHDALCDACSVELPDLESEAGANIVSCQHCEVVFCSQKCHDMAAESYHEALCEREVEAIAKDVPLSEAADSLYSLLLLRSLAMAKTQDCHPLELPEVKYIWGDFNAVDSHCTEGAEHPNTLPFSFKYNITLPFHMLEKMDIDIFADPAYDVWVFNTLYAKFRGTASARLSGLGGRAIRGPEVCAVHPMWCLANHSCDPNVGWEWGGEITFKVREQRAEWKGQENSFCHSEPGVRKDQEILNHYCDLGLPVQERRAWARGALGGDCMCERCIWEARQTN